MFDDNLPTVTYMITGIIPPHWNDLITINSESVTNTNIDLENNRAADVSDCEEDETSPHPNLTLIRSYFKYAPFPAENPLQSKNGLFTDPTSSDSQLEK